MALNKDPIFGSAPRFAAAVVTAANTALDGTGTMGTIFTAGADGAIVTSLVAYARGTMASAIACRLFISTDGGTTRSYMADLLMPNTTVSNTTANGSLITFVNKLNPDSAIRLPANAIIYCTTAVALASGIVFSAEYSDLSA